METDFTPNALPAWIGSLPIKDHDQAVRLMMEYTPEIPIWIQLPHNPNEGMVEQFAPGMPGLDESGDKLIIDPSSDRFEAELLSFYEEYMAVTEGGKDIEESRFALSREAAPGFFTFIAELKSFSRSPAAVKGQVTGPFTFATGLVDNAGRAIFYDDQLRDAAVKQIAMKARWQVRQLKKSGKPVIIFLDEPALAGFGSSAFISVSKNDISAVLEEVMSAVHDEGGLAGIHVCANSEWSIILESSADIVSFDAYSYFDKFAIYSNQLKDFIDRGGIIAWGIVPTDNPEVIEKESTETLYARWKECAEKIAAMGMPFDKIVAQSLITPSCGTGSLSLAHAEKVIRMNREISERIRAS